MFFVIPDTVPEKSGQTVPPYGAGELIELDELFLSTPLQS